MAGFPKIPSFRGARRQAKKELRTFQTPAFHLPQEAAAKREGATSLEPKMESELCGKGKEEDITEMGL